MRFANGSSTGLSPLFRTIVVRIRRPGRAVSLRGARFIVVALVAGSALLLMGCPIVLLKLCALNDTAYPLVELNISPTSATVLGDNQLSDTLAPGRSMCITVLPDAGG